ncbi:TadE family protein [Pirellulimonas nuda]|nr:TadE family protein [Pirellulimonas nuda]
MHTNLTIGAGRPGRRTDRRRGAAVTEFAIVAPVFFLVILGMIEFGRMAMVQQVITNAAREGARIAVLDGATKNKVTQRVADYLVSAGVNSATVGVTPDPPDSAKYGESVSVSVSIPFAEVSWLPTPRFIGGHVLRAESVMRRETVE